MRDADAASRRRPAGKPSLDALALVGLGIAAVGARLWLGPFVSDDAYITLRYARNLAAGAGFTYNPPAHVLGTSSPLFALLMALPAMWHADPRWTALAIATLSDIATIACAALVLRRHGWTLASLMCAVGIALWFPYLTSATSGMETSLSVALLAATLLAVDRSRPVTAAATVGLATLCRPDALLAAAVVFGWTLRRQPRRAARFGAVFAGILAPWLAFSLWYFQTIVPSSITAKVDGRLGAWRSFLVFVNQFGYGVYLPLSALALLGAVVLLRTRRDVVVVGAAWGVLYAAAFVASGAFSFFPWYFVPLYPLYWAAAGAGLDDLARRGLPANVRPSAGRLCVLAAAAVLAARLPHDRDTLRHWFAGREFLYERVAGELRGAGCTLAATEIGTLGYYYDGPVLDLIGLVSPQAIGRPVLDVIGDERPCWVATYDDHVHRADLTAGEFSERYELAFSRRVSADREFLLFRRRPAR